MRTYQVRFSGAQDSLETPADLIVEADDISCNGHAVHFQAGFATVAVVPIANVVWVELVVEETVDA